MAGGNVHQYFSRDQVTGEYFCSFCLKTYAKGTTSTRLRGHLTGEAKTGARSCSNVPPHVKESLSIESSNKRQKTLSGCISSSSSSRQPKRHFEELQLPSQHQLEPPILGDHIADEECIAELMQLDLEEQINKDAPLMENISNFPPGERGSLTEPTTVEPPILGDHIAYEEWIAELMQLDLEEQINKDAPLMENISNFPPGERGSLTEPTTDLVTQVVDRDWNMIRELMMSTHPNESGSVENLPLPNDMIGRTTQLQHQFTNQEAFVRNEKDMWSWLMDDQVAAYFMSQDLRNCRLMDQADQHEVRDEVTVQQEVQMVQGNQETRESVSLTNRPVGDAFGRNVEKIWSWLMDDQVLRISICGMGGVGKTTLMKHIQTGLQGQSSLKFFWVTVSQDFSIWKLQDLIAKKIDLEFLDKEDEVERAEKLTQTLKAKGKCVLILDNLWDNFDMGEVGIPVGVNTCKLVLATRFLKVCRQMDCSERNTIQVQPLSKGEAWILFTQELGNYRIEVEELAKAASRQCAGLPLGIKVMARSMKGICNVHTWRNTLEQLKESKVSKGHEMREEVFSVLKFSYLRLIDPALQECLSYCALFPENDKISRRELIEYMIVVGIIDEKKSRQAEFDKGHTMLGTLENACLLEGDTENVWMHDLIRDMLILELREGSQTLVEAGAQLKELPDVEKWTENLVRVSLMSNDIEEIPSGHTPRCPNLSTLLLCTNRGLRMIADSFFKQFQRLKVLDLSGCGWIEELPRSISDLVNLTALLLPGCRSLIHVPSLAKLEKLKKLDLSGCERLEQMPEGVRFLLNLKYLDLSRSGIKEIETGIILMLSRLQVLKYEDSKFSIRGSEVGELRMLETLLCKFSKVGEFGEYMKSRERSQQSPSDYSIFIGRGYSPWLTISRELGLRKFVSVTGDNFIDPLALPTDIEALKIHFCEGENGEWNGFPFSNYSTHSISNHSLLNLKLIDIWRCHKLKKLFRPCLLPNLHNLQKISVEGCYGMEEIFSAEREEEDGQELLFDQHNPTGLYLSRLTTLELVCLPELRSIYKGVIICHSLQQIQLLNCPKLKRMTLPLPQSSLQRIQVYPKEWWKSLHWGEANDKNRLESLCVFKRFI